MARPERKRGMQGVVGYFMLGLLWCSPDPGASQPVESRPGFVNQGLDLRVEVAPDLKKYRVRAAFSYEAGPGRSGHPFFVFPGVERPSDLELVLDGQTLGTDAVFREPHPRPDRSVDVFAITAGSARTEGPHTLTVTGPWQEHDEPYFARWGGWHPYFGDRSLSVPIEMEVRSTADMRIVASGRHVDESVEEDSRVSRWRTHNPQGWMLLAVGSYADPTRVGDDPPSQLWLPTGFDLQGTDREVLVEEPSRVVRYLEERLGGASLDTVRVVIIPEEDVTNFSIDGTVVGSLGTAERVRENPEYLRAFLAHELVHYWFGDLVQSHGPGGRWIAEGFAEYWRYRYEEAIGADPLAWSLRQQVMLSLFGESDMPTLMAEADGDDEAVFYQKGAHVLHMLEERLGRQTFDEVMRRFVERFRGGEAGPTDFFATATDVSGQELSRFQRQWLERPHGPILADPEVAVRPVGEGYVADVRIVQREPVYGLDLPVVVRTEDGEDHRYVRRVTDREQTFSFELATRPVRVTLDPGGDVFKWYPVDRLPVDFASFREAVLGGAPYRIVTGEDAGQWSPVRDWLVEELGPEAEGSEEPRQVIRLGAAASRARPEVLPTLSAPPDGTIQTFIGRDPGAPGRVVVGVEGTVPESLPPLLPAQPFSFVRFRDGSMVGAWMSSAPELVWEAPAASRSDPRRLPDRTDDAARRASPPPPS